MKNMSPHRQGEQPLAPRGIGRASQSEERIEADPCDEEARGPAAEGRELLDDEPEREVGRRPDDVDAGEGERQEQGARDGQHG